MTVIGRWRIENSREGIPLVFGDGKYPQDPPRAASELESALVERLRGGIDPMRESRIARARGLAQAIAECRDDARLDGIREGAAEIVTLLGGQ